MSSKLGSWTARSILWIAGALAVASVALFLTVALRRIGFPYELEWIEGYTVDHIRRLLAGKPLYARPNIEFVPFAYTPLYFYLSAAVTKLVGVGFLAPRLVSLAASLANGVLVFALARGSSGRPFAGLLGTGLFFATYQLSGFWMDIGRVDALFVTFLLGAALALDRPGLRHGPAIAGVLLACCYLTKQTAVLPLVALSTVALVERRGWQRLMCGGIAAILIGLAHLVLQVRTGGWYSFYTLEVASGHGLGQSQFLVSFWTRDLMRSLAPALAVGIFLLAAALRRRDGRTFTLLGALFVSCLGAAWLSRLHGGGYLNVLLPAHAALAVVFGRGLDWLLTRPTQWPVAMRTLVGSVAVVQLLLLAYNPRPWIPTAEDVTNGDRLVEALREIDGEVYTPLHGYLPVLAGKRSYVHDGVLLTLLRHRESQEGRNLHRQMGEAFEHGRWQAVLLDGHEYRYVKALDERYSPAGPLPPLFAPRRQPRGKPQILYRLRTDPQPTEDRGQADGL